MKITFQNLPKNPPLTFEYQFYKTILGNLIIASFEKSLVYIAFAANQKEALQELKNRFPKADLVKKETRVHKQFIQHLAHPEKSQIFSFATNGTSFQQRVWKALTTIPFGKTCFYSDLAKKLKSPNAVRAVASAVAKNPLAILIPCHRVLPRGGGIGQYHWGVKNKKVLLIWESIR